MEMDVSMTRAMPVLGGPATAPDWLLPGSMEATCSRFTPSKARFIPRMGMR